MLKKRLLRLGSIIIAVAVILIVILFFEYIVYINTDFDDVTISITSTEGAISIEWDANFFTRNHTARITIYESVENADENSDSSSDENSVVNSDPVMTIDVSYSDEHYEFTEGTPLSTYVVTFDEIDTDGNVLLSREESQLFYEELPDLPLMEITTASGNDPSYGVTYPGNGIWDTVTIKDNEDESASFTMTDDEETLYYTSIDIRVRGNTSTVTSEKNSYKLTFGENVDLVGDGKVSCKEWILLLNGSLLHTYVGDLTTKLCDVEWTLSCAFVNVILNGEYIGCFYVTPCVKPDASGGLIDENGYIIEDDAYYWGPDEYPFTVTYINTFYYTLKYPSISDGNDPRLSAAATYMQNMLESVGSGDISTYIDATSFAKWILVRDLLGNSDSSGGNKYFYLTDLDVETATSSSKLKAGPLWDYDTNFCTPDAWSNDHYTTLYYLLFSNEEFCELYREEFYQIQDTFLEDMSAALYELYEENGEAINESWEINNALYGTPYGSLEEQTQDVLEWFTERMTFMEENLNNL